MYKIKLEYLYKAETCLSWVLFYLKKILDILIYNYYCNNN